MFFDVGLWSLFCTAQMTHKYLGRKCVNVNAWTPCGRGPFLGAGDQPKKKLHLQIDIYKSGRKFPSDSMCRVQCPRGKISSAQIDIVE